MKLCSYFDEEAAQQFLIQYRDSFIDRFIKVIYDMADSTEMQQNDQFTQDLKRLSNLEREIFDLHKRQRILFSNFKNKVCTKQVDVNYDLMDEDMKFVNNKRLRIWIDRW